MSRAQQSATYQTASGESQTNETNAQKSEQQEQADIENGESQLAKFAANNPYVQGGQAQTVSNQQLSGTAGATATAAKAGNQALAERTGQNPQAGVAAGEAEAQAAQRELGQQESQATQQRIGDQAQYNQQALSDQNAITQQQENLASLQQGAAQGELGTQEQSAQTPSFLDELGNGLITGTDSFAGGLGQGLCPARGTLILTRDDVLKPIETLTVGDCIIGLDGELQTIEVIDSTATEVLHLEIEGGRSLRVSYAHALARPYGGFVSAVESLGKVVATADGPGRVVSVSKAGVDTVINLITSGSHSYQAGGVWSLGMSQTEREIYLGLRTSESGLLREVA